ncbi:MAG: GNAT family N-acetyltransferase [Candidatus Melainabacteria bacterium]
MPVIATPTPSRAQSLRFGQKTEENAHANEHVLPAIPSDRFEKAAPPSATIQPVGSFEELLADGDILHRLAAETEGVPYFESTPATMEMDKKSLANPQNVFLSVKDENGQTVGGGNLTDRQEYGPVFSSPAANQNDCVGMISNMYFEEPYRRQGLGSQVLSQLEKRAHELGYNRLFLYTTKENEAAQRFYVKHGFRICGPDSPDAPILDRIKTSFFDVSGKPHIFMEKDLPSHDTSD